MCEPCATGGERTRGLDGQVFLLFSVSKSFDNDGFAAFRLDAKSHGEFLFRERVGDAWLASPIQVYLDLLRGEGRGKEMAGHLRHERIGF